MELLKRVCVLFITLNILLFSTIYLSPLCLATGFEYLPSLDPDKKISQYLYDIWTVDNGLPSNLILSFAAAEFDNSKRSKKTDYDIFAELAQLARARDL